MKSHQERSLLQTILQTSFLKLKEIVSLAKTPNSGFTLLEILIVIAIIGVLVAIIIFSLNPVQRLKEARDSVRKTSIRNIAVVLHSYSLSHNGVYPRETGCDSSRGQQGTSCDWTGLKPPPNGSDWSSTPTYIKSELIPTHGLNLPVDPINDTNYFFIYEPRQASYADPGASGDISYCDNNLSTGDGMCEEFVIGARLESKDDYSFVCTSLNYSFGGGYQPRCYERNSLQAP